jgi:hypothetical protein
MSGKKGAAAPDALVQKSPAEFFAENKNIAGFDNVRRRGAAAAAPPRPAERVCAPESSRALLSPLSLPCRAAQPGKCLYTTIRELVENSLDSAESISELPHVEITM